MTKMTKYERGNMKEECESKRLLWNLNVSLRSGGCGIPLNVVMENGLKLDEKADNAERKPSNVDKSAPSLQNHSAGDLKMVVLHNAPPLLYGGGNAWFPACSVRGKTRSFETFLTRFRVGHGESPGV
jgi:hypothetical protein